MEHLPHVENPAYAIPTIPYLGHIVAYDRRGFHEFPERQGWIVHNSTDLRDLGRNIQEGPRNTNLALQTPENLAAFVQAWLFFGVLDETLNVILDLNVSLEDFKDARDGQMFLTTRRLRRHIEDWQDKCYDLHVTKVTTKVTTGYDGKGRSSEARAPYYVM
jgi:hypothetical protein